MRDMKNNIAAQPAIVPEVLTGNRTGSAIDLKESNRMAFVITTGAVAGSGAVARRYRPAALTA